MHDAHVILEAVRLHKLQPVTRRLNEVEVSHSLPFLIGGPMHHKAYKDRHPSENVFYPLRLRICLGRVRR